MTVNYLLDKNMVFDFSLEEDSKSACDKIMRLTFLSMKSMTNSYYKPSPYLEPRDIEQIKSSLSNYKNNDEKVDQFKKELINDLTNFQKQINKTHVQSIADLTKEKQSHERQIRVLEFEKHKIIMGRLSKIIWPYDNKTKEYNNQIAKLKIQIQQNEQKILTLQQTRPFANEKDLLLYKMHLKEKYADED